MVAGLLRRLWIDPPPEHVFRTLQAMCAHWVDEFEQQVAAHPSVLDPGLARAGLALLRALPADTDRAGLLVTDLHVGNVLASRREPWLEIDPKPHVGDSAYDATQHLLNCAERLHAVPAGLADRMAGLLEVDPVWLAAGFSPAACSRRPATRRWPISPVASRSTDSRRRGRPRAYRRPRPRRVPETAGMGPLPAL